MFLRLVLSPTPVTSRFLALCLGLSACRAAPDAATEQHDAGAFRWEQRGDSQSVVPWLAAPHFVERVGGGTWRVTAEAPVLESHGARATYEDDGARIDGTLSLTIPLDRDPGGVLGPAAHTLEITLSAPKERRVRVFLNGEALGRLAVGPRGVHRLDVPASRLRSGDNRLRIETGFDDVRFYALSLGHENAPALRERLVTRKGERLRAVVTPPSGGRLSAFAWIPSGAALSLAVSGDGPYELAVRDRHGRRSLMSGQGTDSWQELALPLAAHAREVVRVDLVSKGVMFFADPAFLVEQPPREPSPLVRHVVIWTVSSLRADALGEDTPRMRAFCQQGIWRDAQAPSFDPAWVHAAILTGRPEIGRTPETQTLAEAGRTSGVASALLSGNGFLSDETGFARGFDLYENPMRERRPHSARVLARKARRFLRQHREGRAFVYVATSEPHLPYTPDADTLRRFWTEPQPWPPARSASVLAAAARGRSLSSREIRYAEALYRAEVADADAGFGAFLDDLAALGLADSTAVILVGDHGEAPAPFFGRPQTLATDGLLVPLCARAPGVTASRRRRVVETVDVHATVRGWLGAGRNQGRGLSLFSESVWPRPVRAFARHGRSLRVGQYKWQQEGAKERLFDISRDPLEQRDIAMARPLALRFLRAAAGVEAAFGKGWDSARWGHVLATTRAFVDDVARSSSDAERPRPADDR